MAKKKNKNKNELRFVVIGLALVVLVLVMYILFANVNSKYNYENLEGYYEIFDDEADSVSAELLLFKDGSFQLVENLPHYLVLGNYLIDGDKIVLNYQLGFGGGYPMPISSLSETVELTIDSLDNLVSADGKYVRNETLEDAKLVKVSFDGDKDYIVDGNE